MNANLYSLFRSGFGDRLDHPFLVELDGATHSYGDIDGRSEQFAAVLMEHGVKLGERVVVQIDKSADGVALYLACLRIGAVFVTLNTAYTPEEVSFFLNDAAPRVFITTPSSLAKFEPIAKAARIAVILTLGSERDGTLADATTTAEPLDGVVQSQGSDVAAMLYTSGTTGRSKGALLTHDGLAATAQGLFEAWRWQRDDVLLHVLPIFHVHGLFIALHPAMLGASTVLFHHRFELETTLDALPKATVLMGVPTIYNRLLRADRFTPELCTNMRLFTSGSAPLPADKHDEFTTKSGHVLVNRYGMTEAGVITSNRLDHERPAGTVGFAMPGLELRVVDDHGEPAAPDTPGMVEIKGPSLFGGYWQLPDKTASEHRDDGFFITGDVGRLSVDGMLTLDGRAGDMIISGGLNVYPREIELCLNEVEGVFETAVVGLPHHDLGEAVTAFVVLDEPGSADDTSIDEMIAQRLARFKQPKSYIYLDELPRNAMSKVQKANLRQEYSGLYS